MTEYIRKGIRYVLLAILIIGLEASCRHIYQSLQSESSYREAQELVNMTGTEEMFETSEAETELTGPELRIYEQKSTMALLEQINIDKLKEVNQDVTGWIVIPNTQIAYPLMGGTGNSYYLDHTWKREVNSGGAIFIEEKNSLDLQNHNTIIYGHRMRNGSMFGSLKEYQKQEYWEEHPEIYIRVDERCLRYEIFAAYEASVSGLTYQVGFEDEESKQKFLEDCTKRSVISTGIVPQNEDRILTLSTCTGRGYSTRWVVQARLVQSLEVSVSG